MRRTSSRVDTFLGRRRPTFVPSSPARVEQLDDRVHQIAHVQHATAVVDATERQRRAACDRAPQRQKVAAHARTVHQRRAQDRQRQARRVGDFSESLLGLPLRSRISVFRMRRIGLAKRPARRRRLAVDLDRAHENEARNTCAHGRSRKPFAGDDVGFPMGVCGVHRAVARDVRASGEMHDGVGTVERARERVVGRRREVTDRSAFRFAAASGGICTADTGVPSRPTATTGGADETAGRR